MSYSAEELAFFASMEGEGLTMAAQPENPVEAANRCSGGHWERGRKPTLDEVFARLGIPRPQDGRKFRLDMCGLGTAWIHEGRICSGENLQGISPTDFFMEATGKDFVAAMEDFNGGTMRATPKPTKKEPVALERIELQNQLPANSERLGRLAQLRGIPLAILERAVSDGVLRFATVCGREAFVVGDCNGFCFEARRLDGKLFEAFGELTERKVHSKGRKKFPLQWGDLPTAEKILLCEGSADFLAAGALLGGGVGAILGVLGKGINLPPETLETIAGKAVVIFGHGDAQERVDAWQRQLRDAGAAVAAFFEPAGLDLNDLLEVGRIGEFVDFLELPIPRAKPATAKPTAASFQEDPLAVLPGEVALPSAGFTSLSDAATSLFALLKTDGNFYRRGGSLCRLADGALAFKSALQVAGEVDFLGTFTRIKSTRGKAEKKPRAIPTESEMKMLLANDRAAAALPEIEALAPMPFAYPVGRFLKFTGSGYVPEMKTFVTGGVAIDRGISLEDAIELLNSVLTDFIFVTDGDKARALSMFLAPAMKIGRFLGDDKFPLFLVEADDSQAGKGFLSELVPAIYGGAFADIHDKKGGVGSIDESISERLAAGAALVRFDNFRGALDSKMLESVMTAPGNEPIGFRLPHRGTVYARVNSLFFGTSNGMQLTRDQANRTAFIRIKKQRENYRFRRWGGVGIEQFIRKNQGRFLGAIYAVLAQWVAGGCNEKQGGGSFEGRFRRWGEAMDGILEPFGLPSVSYGMKEMRLMRSDEIMVWLREVAIRLRGRSGLTASQVCSEAEEMGIDPPFTGDHAQGFGRRCKVLFAESNEILIDDIKFTREEGWDTDKGRHYILYAFI